MIYPPKKVYVKKSPVHGWGVFASEKIFKDDAEEILRLMPQDTEENKHAYDYMKSILDFIIATKTPDLQNAKNLIVHLNEIDRRRGTDWRKTFVWLRQFDNVVQ